MLIPVVNGQIFKKYFNHKFLTNEKNNCIIQFALNFLIDNAGTPAALGLGYSSVYNHSYNANAAYTISLHNACLMIKAVKAINAGDEITLNYNGRPDDTTAVYFHPETI
jgi:hypothetical protein